MAEREPQQNQREPEEKRSIGGKISRIVWDCDDKSEEERQFVKRLDLGLMTIACLGYFVKYLDQANVTNAYAAGMQADLGFQGNDYNTLLSMFTAGYVIGQFPGTLLMTVVSPAIWLPACEVFWSILVFACAGCKDRHQLMVLRFFIGLAEATAYPGMLWCLGSWYNKMELGKRAVIFQSSSSAAYMFSGYLQAAVLHLNGRNGLKGWQWLFIMDGVISMPIAILGFFMIPNTPNRPNKLAEFWLKPADFEYARQRMAKIKRPPQKGFTLSTFKNAFFNSPWALTFAIPYICYVVGLGSYAYFNLFLKAVKYSATQVQVVPTAGYGLSIACALSYSWTSDAIGKRWPVIVFAGLIAMVGNIILAIWPSSNSGKFAGFFLSYTVTGSGALMLAWANELSSKYGAEERSITLGFLNTISYVFNSWVPNLVWPASQAPHYKVGYKASAAFFGIYILGTFVIFLITRSRANMGLDNDDDSVIVGSPSEEGESEKATAPIEGVAALQVVGGTATTAGL